MQPHNLNLNLWVDDNINTAFVKANLALLSKYSQEFQDSKDKETLLEKLWLKEYGVQLVKSNQQYCNLKFASGEDRTVFLIKWS
jgi:predicted metal-dependent hydrolase